MEIAPHFTGFSLALALAVVAYVLAVEPWLGRRMYENLRRHRDDDPGALVRFFGWGIGTWWALAAAVVAIVVTAPGVRPADVGLVAGDPARTGGLLGGAAAGVLVGALLAWWLRGSGRPAPGERAIAAMLPRTPRERWAALAASVTAGVCEELVFRGLLIALGVGLLGLDAYAAAGASLLVFVLAHLYQGAGGMIGVGVIGLALTGLYLSTGSLLVPIVVHALIDIRGLVLAPPRPGPVPARGTGGHRALTPGGGE